MQAANVIDDEEAIEMEEIPALQIDPLTPLEMAEAVGALEEQLVDIPAPAFTLPETLGQRILLEQNTSLVEQNRQLHADNEQLREKVIWNFW